MGVLRPSHKHQGYAVCFAFERNVRLPTLRNQSQGVQVTFRYETRGHGANRFQITLVCVSTSTVPPIVQPEPPVVVDPDVEPDSPPPPPPAATVTRATLERSSRTLSV